MAQYGQLLENVDSIFEKIYKDFDDYFNHPTMVKIKEINGYSMYMSKMYCLLSNECRYIIVFVSNDFNPIKSKEALKNLKWDSLQTRTLSDKYDLPSHGYQPRHNGPLNVLITREKILPECSVYNCDDLPLIITLLHGKNGPNDYQKKGNIIAGLETYNTIITFVNKNENLNNHSKDVDNLENHMNNNVKNNTQISSIKTIFLSDDAKVTYF